MTNLNLTKPLPAEHSAFFNRYISIVPDENILVLLKNQLSDSLKFFERIDEDKSCYCYADGKWTIKEILGHLADTEQILLYRALRIARNDKTPLPGFNENAFVDNAFFNKMSFTSLIEYFILTRKMTLGFLRTVDNEAWTRI